MRQESERGCARRHDPNRTFERAHRLEPGIGRRDLKIEHDLARAPADLRAQRLVHGVPGAAASPVVDELAQCRLGVSRRDTCGIAVAEGARISAQASCAPACGRRRMPPARSRSASAAPMRPASARCRAASEAAIGWPTVHRPLPRQQGLQQTQLVLDGEVTAVRPQIGAAVTDEVGRDDTKLRLQHVDCRGPHDRGAGEPCSSNTGAPVPTAKNGAAQDRMGSAHAGGALDSVRVGKIVMSYLAAQATARKRFCPRVASNAPAPAPLYEATPRPRARLRP